MPNRLTLFIVIFTAVAVLGGFLFYAQGKQLITSPIAEVAPNWRSLDRQATSSVFTKALQDVASTSPTTISLQEGLRKKDIFDKCTIFGYNSSRSGVNYGTHQFTTCAQTTLDDGTSFLTFIPLGDTTVKVLVDYDKPEDQYSPGRAKALNIITNGTTTLRETDLFNTERQGIWFTNSSSSIFLSTREGEEGNADGYTCTSIYKIAKDDGSVRKLEKPPVGIGCNCSHYASVDITRTAENTDEIEITEEAPRCGEWKLYYSDVKFVGSKKI